MPCCDFNIGTAVASRIHLNTCSYFHNIENRDAIRYAKFTRVDFHSVASQITLLNPIASSRV
jgi:hypothetical protein